MKSLLICGLLLLGLPLPGQEASTVTRWHDLGGRAWLQQLDVRAPQLLPLEATLIHDDEAHDRADLGKARWRTMPGASDGRNVLAMLLGREFGDRVEINLTEAGKVLVTATPADQDLLASALRTLRSEFTRTATITVLELPSAALRNAPARMLTKDVVAGLVKAHGCLGVSRQTIQLGSATRFRSGRRLGIIPQTDVEVASTVSVDSPESRALLLGQDITVSVSRTHAGRLFVQCALSDADLVSSPEEFPIGSGMVFGQNGGRESMALGDLQLASIASTLARSSGVLNSGSALCLGHGDTSNRGRTWIVQVEASEGPQTIGGTATSFFPLAHLLSPDLPGLFALPRSQDARGRDDDPSDDEEEPSPIFSEDELNEQLNNIAQSLGDDDVEVLRVGEFMAMRSVQSARARAESVLNEMANSHGRTLHFEWRFGRTKIENPLAADIDGLADLKTSARTTAREGDLLGVIGGTERSRVIDYDVEIAQATAVGVPIVRSLFTGIAVRGRATLTPEGKVMLQGQLFEQQERGHRVFQAGGPAHAGVDQADTIHHEAQGTWKLTPGKWQTLLIAPDSASDRQFVAAVRVTVEG